MCLKYQGLFAIPCTSNPNRKFCFRITKILENIGHIADKPQHRLIRNAQKDSPITVLPFFANPEGTSKLHSAAAFLLYTLA
jgi:hypothetical protein